METNMNNVLLVGKNRKNKKELLKELAYSVATDVSVPYEVTVIDSSGAFDDILNLPFMNENRSRLKIIGIDDVDLTTLRKSFTLNPNIKNVVVVPEIDSYKNHSDYLNLLEFVFYISAFGKAIGAHSMVSAIDDMELIKDPLLSQMALNTSQLYCIFSTDEKTANVFKNVLKLSEEDKRSLVTLKDNDYVLLEHL